MPYPVDETNKLQLKLLDDYTYGVEGFSEEDCTELNIPATYNGIPVTKIIDTAFKGNTNITKVSIPGTIKTIDYCEFKGCTGLTELNIAEGVETIQTEAFMNCTSLQSVVIPDSVRTLSGAFEGCSALASVKLGANLEYIMMNAFKGTAITSITIPSKVIRIQNSVFENCTNLTSVNIPASVKNMGIDIFKGTDNLTSLKFEKTEGWQLAESAIATSGTPVSSTDIANESAAVAYFKSNNNYFWICS